MKNLALNFKTIACHIDGALEILEISDITARFLGDVVSHTLDYCKAVELETVEVFYNEASQFGFTVYRDVNEKTVLIQKLNNGVITTLENFLTT